MWKLHLYSNAEPMPIPRFWYGRLLFDFWLRGYIHMRILDTVDNFIRLHIELRWFIIPSDAVKSIFQCFQFTRCHWKYVCHFSALSCGNLIFMHWFVVKVVYIALSLRARYFALWLRSINLAIGRVTFLSFHQFEIL